MNPPNTHQPLSSQSTLPASRILSLEGNLGSGKTSFLRIIQQHIPQIQILDEPICSWQKIGEEEVNLLEYYYKDPSRWGLTFQSFAFFTRLKKWAEYQAPSQSTAAVKLSERSILADRFIFASIMRDSEYLSEDEYQVYLETYNGFMDLLDIKPVAGIIYLKCSPEVCVERIKKRNRSEELSIPFEYLQKIHNKHEEWLSSLPNVLVLDTNQDFISSPEKVKDFVQKLRDFVENIGLSLRA